MKHSTDPRGENTVIKGCQKRMIKIKCHKSQAFEEAYFILKDSEEEADATCDIVREAELLLEEDAKKSCRRFSFGWSEVLFFGAGILLSALFFAVLKLFW